MIPSIKRTLFFAAALLLTAGASRLNAQSVHLVAKVGANFSKLEGQQFKDGFNFGYTAGASLEADFVKGFGIQPELLFNQTNTTYSNNPGIALQPNENIHLNYLTVPVLLRFNPIPFLTLNAGPQFGILLNNHKTVAGNAVNAYKDGDFAIALGAQIHVSGLRVFARYNIGLSDNRNYSDVSNQDKWTSEQIQVGLGLRLL